MATVIESDGIRVEADSEQEALVALRKAKREQERANAARVVARQKASERACVNGWRVLSAFLSDGGLDSRYIAWCEANSPCAPVVRSNGAGGVIVEWQSTNGADARAEWWADPIIKGGLCDAGGWLVAILTGDGWFAVGDDQGETAMEKLPEGFKPELN